MGMDTESQLRDHERRIRAQGDALEYESAQAAVALCAISALVESHPDPGAFARAFRAQWQRLGAQNQSQPAESQGAEGMDDALSVLEASCRVALGVRPPGRAAPPGRD